MQTTPDARATAARALGELERRDAYSDALLDGVFRRAPGLSPRDRALATQIVYGVLRWRHRLDRFIETAAERPLKKLDPRLLTVLRVGAFQLLFLDRVPGPAAVSETVELAGRLGMERAKGLANAVLRRIAAGDAVPPVPEDPADRLALEHSVPPWLAAHWMEREGEEGAALLARASSRVPPLYLRVDTRLLSREEALASLAGAKGAGFGAFAPESVWVEGAGDPRALPPVRGKKALVQGQASQLVAPLLRLRPGMRVLDACAAPGMKTAHIARLLDGKGEVVALDVHDHRVRQIETLMRDLGYDCVKAEAADARAYRPEGGAPFDAVLVDAPCSGLGVLAHAPERKWRAAPEDIPRMAALQREILEGAAAAVRPGGVLVYATCTTPREENEGVAESFLDAHPEFAPEPVGAEDGIPDFLRTPAGFLRTFPRDPGGGPAEDIDAFFAARMRRRGS